MGSYSLAVDVLLHQSDGSLMTFTHFNFITTRWYKSFTFHNTSFSKISNKCVYLFGFVASQENICIWEKLDLLDRMFACTQQPLNFSDVFDFLRKRTISAFCQPNPCQLFLNIFTKFSENLTQKFRDVAMKLILT